MLYTDLHNVNISDIDWQTAHLFEHLLIDGFYNLTNEKGVRTEMLMWLRGETFHDVLFFDVGFYDAALSREFNNYLQSDKRFKREEIDSALAVISAEERKIINVVDYRSLIEVLNELWVRLGGKATKTSLAKTNLKLLRELQDGKRFHDITIVTTFDDVSEESQKLLLRLRILFMDLIEKNLNEPKGGYMRGHSSMLKNGNSMAFMTQYTFNQNIGINEVSEALESIKTQEVDKYMDSIRKHFDVYVSEPVWENLPIEYFRDTAIVTTNKEIASYGSIEHVQALFDKASFKVRKSLETDADYII